MSDKCNCRACLRLRDKPDAWPAECTRMILCAICGNKRCPHATDHRHACTNSNERGQAGSAYGDDTSAPAIPDWLRKRMDIAELTK